MYHRNYDTDREKVKHIKIKKPTAENEFTAFILSACALVNQTTAVVVHLTVHVHENSESVSQHCSQPWSLSLPTTVQQRTRCRKNTNERWLTAEASKISKMEQNIKKKIHVNRRLNQYLQNKNKKRNHPLPHTAVMRAGQILHFFFRQSDGRYTRAGFAKFTNSRCLNYLSLWLGTTLPYQIFRAHFFVWHNIDENQVKACQILCVKPR